MNTTKKTVNLTSISLTPKTVRKAYKLASAAAWICAKTEAEANWREKLALLENKLIEAERIREVQTAEILDLRSLSPYDWEGIATSVKKTNRVIVAYEDTRSWGYGAEIAARIADELFYDLDGPVRRVAATDTFCAYQPKLEDAILPQTDDIVRAVRDLIAF